MELLVTYLNEGHSLSELLSAAILIASVIICIEKVLKWLYSIFIKFYNQKRGIEEGAFTLDKNTNEIKNLSDKIENLALLLNKQYQHLDKKIDEQAEHIAILDKDGKDRDCAILRDRILESMHTFNQNKDKEGKVHISVVDHENLDHLFNAYFSCNGNGTVKRMYDNEFKNWIIDN